MLIEFHIIQNHAPANLNRDDTGSPKDCLFGGERRSRISSQCLKRSIRCSKFFREPLKSNGLGVRTRRLPQKVKAEILKKGYSDEIANIVEEKTTGFGTKDGKERKDKVTAQTMFITDHDIEAITEAMVEKIEECKKDPEEIKKLKVSEIQKTKKIKAWRPITPDIALFGRMTTSDAFRDVEASMQVAHAISTNKMAHEFDYYTAVDDLQPDTEEGADMIGDIEFNSACYYKYFSLNLEGFRENLLGPDHEKTQEVIGIVAEMVRAFLRAAAFVTPTGKQNSFAAHQLPDAILVEAKEEKIPVSYANAFIKPAYPKKNKDLVEVSLQKFADHVKTLKEKYCLNSGKSLFFTTNEDISIAGVEDVPNIEKLIEELENLIKEGCW